MKFLDCVNGADKKAFFKHEQHHSTGSHSGLREKEKVS